MSKISAKYSLERFENLYQRTLNLPKEIITDDDFKKSFSKAENYEKEYEQKRLSILYDAQQICVETRSLVKLIFGHESEYLTWINKIDFTSESKGYIMNTFNIGHNNHWQIGKNSLFSLISNIKNEETERMNYENSLVDKTIPIKFATSGVLFVIFMLATWTATPETIAFYFDSSKILPVKISISLLVSSLLAIIPFKIYWKELVFSSVLVFGVLLISFLKPTEIQPKQPIDTLSNKKPAIHKTK